MQETSRENSHTLTMDFFDQLLRGSNYLVLLNGGAILAYLTALKDLRELRDISDVPVLVNPGPAMALLICGVLFAVFGYGTLLITRMMAIPLNGKRPSKRLGILAIGLSVFFNGSSTVAFAWTLGGLAERLLTLVMK